MEITAKTAQELRLTSEEFHLIQQKLGRTPNFTELCAFSAMWSEHCSYKNSIKLLKTLPREGRHMLVKAGEENAGLMDLGDGLGVVFKIESHNHPSAIEPFQGAATGVGGIHRDIFTMGARPIASLNSLRFGSLQEPKTQRLLSGVVHGIGHYGNCFGVPTIGGEIYFDECYHTNPLVNAMSVGIVRSGHTVSATALGAGNPVVYVGSATGKDGIGGASFASANITEESAEDLPAVQVGDPFQEKKLLEACLEVIQTGAVVGMQDMGAAGIICSTSEMSAKGEVGMDIELGKVPARQQHMKAWELLLSESQERMLMVVQKGREPEVLSIFEKWDLPCATIGSVTDGGLLRFYLNGQLEAEIPAQELVLGGGAPQYDRDQRMPAYLEEVQKFNPENISIPSDLKAVADRLIASPNIASKKWIAQQYDSTVGAANASTNAPSDAAVVVIKGHDKAIAMTTDCNSRYVYGDPRKGAQIAVAEAARNLVCTGAIPLGVTNCLNFGNPYDPEVYYQFAQAIQGMGEACRTFDTPVTGGNVSFYNQSPDGPVFPTPTIGMVGVLASLEARMTLDFKQPDDLIFLLGKVTNDLGSSEYLYRICGQKKSPAPAFELKDEWALHEKLRALLTKKCIVSAHDVSDGGLFVTLLESAMPRHLGFEVALDLPSIRPDAFWFGESQSRVVVSVPADLLQAFLKEVEGFPCLELGKVHTDSIFINGKSWGRSKAWKDKYDGVIDTLLATTESEGALGAL